jgi:predicted amidophosphoribosyltransferase
MLHKGPGFCPDCGERVSPFAAGCAICGAELDPQRWQRPPSLRERVRRRVQRPAPLRPIQRSRKSTPR